MTTNAESCRSYRQKRAALGICLLCKESVAPGKKRCAVHEEAAKKYRREWAQRNGIKISGYMRRWRAKRKEQRDATRRAVAEGQ